MIRLFLILVFILLLIIGGNTVNAETLIRPANNFELEELLCTEAASETTTDKCRSDKTDTKTTQIPSEPANKIEENEGRTELNEVTSSSNSTAVKSGDKTSSITDTAKPALVDSEYMDTTAVVKPEAATETSVTEQKPKLNPSATERSAEQKETFHERQTAAEPKTTEKVTEEEKQYVRYGTNGCLFIPSVGIQVPVYYSDLYFGDTQDVVDASDSAAMFWYMDSVSVIADHRRQGFWSLPDVSVGDIAYIAHPDGSRDDYICTRVCWSGYNTGKSIQDDAGVDVSESGADLIAYTCLSYWQDIFIAYFRYY